MTESIRPVERLTASVQPPRLPGIDVARALAIFGMVAAHVASGPPAVDITHPSTYPALVHGRPSILFALLAGVSLSLMTGRGTRPATPDAARITRLQLIGRALAIFFVGLLLELLGTGIAVILTFYGVLYFVSLPFVWAKTRTLVATGLTLGLVGPSVLAVIDYLVPQSTMSTATDLVLGVAYSLPTLWGILLLGMAIGRLNLTNTRVLAGMVAVGVCASTVGYGVGTTIGNTDGPTGAGMNHGDRQSGSTSKLAQLISQLKQKKQQQPNGNQKLDPSPEKPEEGTPAPGIVSKWGQYRESLGSAQEFGKSIKDSVVSSTPHSGGAAEFIGSGGCALIIVGLCQLVVTRARRWFIPLAVTGAMPLTIYTAHVIVVFAAVGPGGRISSNLLYWTLVMGSIAGANAWMAFCGRGPLERFPRWLGGKIAGQ